MCDYQALRPQEGHGSPSCPVSAQEGQAGIGHGFACRYNPTGQHPPGRQRPSVATGTDKAHIHTASASVDQCVPRSDVVRSPYIHHFPSTASRGGCEATTTAASAAALPTTILRLSVAWFSRSRGQRYIFLLNNASLAAAFYVFLGYCRCPVRNTSQLLPKRQIIRD